MIGHFMEVKRANEMRTEKRKSAGKLALEKSPQWKRKAPMMREGK